VVRFAAALVVLLPVMAVASCDRSRGRAPPAHYPPPLYQPTAANAPANVSGQAVAGAADWNSWLAQMLGTGPAAVGGAPWPFALPSALPSGVPTAWFPLPLPGSSGGGGAQPPPAPAGPPAPPPGAPAAPPIGARARDLANAINSYRAQNGLPAVPLSARLTQVAEIHARDLPANPLPTECNAHSWTSRGAWTSCCYTGDHKQAQCMWSKPREVSGFDSTGFEIAIGKPGVVSGYVLDSHRAVDLWKSSPPHNDVILNRGQWASVTWKALGAGIIDSHACAWFARDFDPVDR
jgi:hypothetical protein